MASPWCNVSPDTFTKRHCSTVTTMSSTLQDIHDMLCHPGFLFAFPCKDINTHTVIRCLDLLFTLLWNCWFCFFLIMLVLFRLLNLRHTLPSMASPPANAVYITYPETAKPKERYKRSRRPFSLL